MIYYWLWLQCCVTATIGYNYNMNLIDPLMAQIKFSLQSDTNLDTFNQIVMRVGIYNRIGCNCDLNDRITLRIQFFSILTGMIFIIHVLIKVSFLNASRAKFDAIIPNVDKLSEFVCDYANNSNITITARDICKIHGTAMVVGFFLSGIVQEMDVSPLNIVFDTIIVTVAQSVLNSFVQLSIDVVDCHTQVIRNVCDAFCYLFLCFLNFFF